MTRRYAISVKYASGDCIFYGPFESQDQADDWADGARRAWPQTTVVVFPLESPWDA